jgi:hypothetical protein
VKLIDPENYAVANKNKLTASVTVYAPDSPPAEVRFNSLGNKLLKGPI